MKDWTQIEPGWALLGGDGEPIASVDEVDPDYLIVRAGFLDRRDIFVPREAVLHIDPDGKSVAVEQTNRTIDAMGWDEVPMPLSTTPLYPPVEGGDAITSAQTP